MSKYLLALVGVPLLAGMATAQGAPQPLPVGEAVETAEVVVAPAPAPSCAPTCDPCCTPLKKVCVPMPSKKTTIHVEYSHKCDDICLPGCSGGGCKLFGKGKDCGGCESCDTDCGKVRERRKLVKKFRKEECDSIKCEPVLVPDTECKKSKWGKKAKADPCCDPCVVAPCAPVQAMPIPK